MAEEADVGAAVDDRGFEDLARQIAEEAAEQKDRHGEAESGLRQGNAEIGIEQAEIAHLDEQRQDRGCRRETEGQG